MQQYREGLFELLIDYLNVIWWKWYPAPAAFIQKQNIYKHTFTQPTGLYAHMLLGTAQQEFSALKHGHILRFTLIQIQSDTEQNMCIPVCKSPHPLAHTVNQHKSISSLSL